MTQTTHVKVARCIVDPSDGREFVKPLGNGGEAQLWERSIWDRYYEFIEKHPQARGSQYYPWTYIEDMNPPAEDLGNYVLLPEKTGGKEFLIVKTK